VRTGAGAAVGVVAKGVDVHAALGVGVVARDVPGDLGVGGLGGLLESDGALDVGVTTDNSDYARRRTLAFYCRCVLNALHLVRRACQVMMRMCMSYMSSSSSSPPTKRHERHTAPRGIS
jgi:hypothetical protein